MSTKNVIRVLILSLLAGAMMLALVTWHADGQDIVPGKKTPTPALTSKKKPKPTIRVFGFDTVKIDARGNIAERRKGQAQYFVEDLGNGVSLEMVEIPAGTFTMGSPENEVWSFYNENPIHSSGESPQHQVSVPAFAMGKYEVTQAQWREVAKLPKVKIDLDPNPSHFKGDNLPVEQVSWDETVEFCERLSRNTGRQYCLPSEAEWEYACRAGTSTPFAFGPTVTSEIVNYNGNFPHGNAPKGAYRGTTIPVGSLGVANAFGLYDMHGNVFEWCQDMTHENYNGAPSNGRAWMDGGGQDKHIMRGGSWGFGGGICRAAFRILPAKNSIDLLGFRVVLAASTR